jgi:hypothetical protein
MIGAKLEDLRAAVAVARQPVTDWDAFAGAMDLSRGGTPR